DTCFANLVRHASVEELSRRVRLAREQLQGFDLESNIHAPFLWLKLPEPWMSGNFKNAAFRDGVLVDDEDEFKAARGER
ncbi:PLP-dependent aminotransferase family protein, partial [Rhizobium johnstonii]